MDDRAHGGALARYASEMNPVIAIIPSLVLVAACGTIESTDSSTPSKSAAPIETPSQESHQDNCIKVSQRMAKRITASAEPRTGMRPGLAAAVKSPNFQNVYFIAMRFKVTGMDDHVGVWAANRLKPASALLMAIDSMAQEFTMWPDGDRTVRQIDTADPSVNAARDCL